MTQPNDPTGMPPTPPPGAPLNYSSPGGTGIPDDAKMMAMLAHILCFTLIGPLIIYLVKKGQNAFLDTEAKEALNFSLSAFLIQVGLGVAGGILARILVFLGCITSLASAAVGITVLVLGIMAGLKARDGIGTQYPFNFRLIK